MNFGLPYYQPAPMPYGQTQQPFQLPQYQQQPVMPQQPQQTAQAAPLTQDERIWVQGEGAAMAYLVAPGGFARLWDSTQPVFYEKRCDASGRPLQMETYDYTRRIGNPAPASDDRLKALEDRIAALEAVTRGGEPA